MALEPHDMSDADYALWLRRERALILLRLYERTLLAFTERNRPADQPKEATDGAR